MLSYPEELQENEEYAKKTSLVYEGHDLVFTDEELTAVLMKHMPYFRPLSMEHRIKFLQRLKKFISIKTFYIHDESGFKEMPILISATAIQLTFGLEKYLLQNFDSIHIYPEEFIGVYPTLRVLEGNVSGHSINLSWKHFLQGFMFPDDGQNVGLHEFAHAYYYQYFEAGKSVDKAFISTFPHFNENSNSVLEQEQKPGYDLYSEYGLSNSQEFWAESIEIFFEKPVQLKVYYPNMYQALTRLLNQDPAAKKMNEEGN